MFFAFPLEDKPDWRHPPWATLLLILLTMLVYLGPQRWDHAAAERAEAFYVQSNLPRLELPRYVARLRERGDAESLTWAERIDAALKARKYAGPYQFMLNDRAFVARLHAGRVIRPDEPDYALWREEHLQYRGIRGTPFTDRWAMNPASLRPATLLSAIFLHGSLAHLIGNMVFLFLFGYTLEKSLGSARYLAFYLAAGLGGGLADLGVRWGSPIPSLGASGAISGLMAMYVVLYGRRRIKFFYQLLFYFDYVSAPAIILLPAWIAHELLQQWIGREGVAYMAHAGGLVAGGLLMAWQKRAHPETKAPVAEPAVDPAQEALARVEALTKELRLDEARAILAPLAAGRPRDPRVLAPYFNLAKLKPAGEDFHKAAGLVFALTEADTPTSKLVRESFAAYMQAAKPAPRLAPADLARLALRFGREGHGADCAKLARMLIERAPEQPELPGVLLAAVSALRRQGDAAAANEMYGELSRRFPQSSEARMAAPGRS